MNAFRQLVTDSALAAFQVFSDPAVSPESAEAVIARLKGQFIIDDRRYSEVLNDREKMHIVEVATSNIWGVLNALRNDDFRGLIAHCSALSAKLELTQHSWAHHEPRIADAALLLLEINKELPSLPFLIRPARKAMITGQGLAHNLIDVALGTRIVSRAQLVQNITATGLRSRLESARPMYMKK